jgi:hypothetical protein
MNQGEAMNTNCTVCLAEVEIFNLPGHLMWHTHEADRFVDMLEIYGQNQR